MERPFLEPKQNPIEYVRTKAMPSSTTSQEVEEPILESQVMKSGLEEEMVFEDCNLVAQEEVVSSDSASCDVTDSLDDDSSGDNSQGRQNDLNSMTSVEKVAGMLPQNTPVFVLVVDPLESNSNMSRPVLPLPAMNEEHPPILLNGSQFMPIVQTNASDLRPMRPKKKHTSSVNKSPVGPIVPSSPKVVPKARKFTYTRSPDCVFPSVKHRRGNERDGTFANFSRELEETSDNPLDLLTKIACRVRRREIVNASVEKHRARRRQSEAEEKMTVTELEKKLNRLKREVQSIDSSFVFPSFCPPEPTKQIHEVLTNTSRKQREPQPKSDEERRARKRASGRISQKKATLKKKYEGIYRKNYIPFLELQIKTANQWLDRHLIHNGLTIEEKPLEKEVHLSITEDEKACLDTKFAAQMDLEFESFKGINDHDKRPQTEDPPPKALQKQLTLLDLAHTVSYLNNISQVAVSSSSSSSPQVPSFNQQCLV